MLYMTEQDSTLEVILGARNLDDMLTRIDSAKSVSALDANVLSQVKSFRGDRAAGRQAPRPGPVGAAAGRRPAGSGKAVDRGIDRRAAAGLQLDQERDRPDGCGAARPPAADGAPGADPVPAGAAGGPGPAPDDRGRDHGRRARAGQIAAPPSTHTGVVGVALSELGAPYVWGGLAPGRLRLLRARHVRLRAGRRLAAAQRGAQYGYGVPVSRDRPPAGRPRLLRRPRARRHLHRRRPVRPRAAHRRRRQDLEPQRALVPGSYVGARRHPRARLRATARRPRRRSARRSRGASASASASPRRRSIEKSRGRIAKRLICS